jgi:hypothetical protein
LLEKLPRLETHGAAVTPPAGRSSAMPAGTIPAIDRIDKCAAISRR